MQALQSLVTDLIQPANLSLVLATVWAINSIYAPYAAPVTIALYAASSRTHWQQRDFIEAVLLTSQKHQAKHDGDKVLFLIEDNYGDVENMSSDWNYRNQAGREMAIWIVDSLVALTRLVEDLLNPSKNYFRNGYFCIIYAGLDYTKSFLLTQEFSLRLFALYMNNVNFFIMRGDTIELYTFFPFAPNGQCNSDKPELYMSFRDVRDDTYIVSQKPFFPNKVRNMYGCKLNVTTWTYPPFQFVENDPQTGELVRMHGIEGLLMSTLAQQMNFTIRLEPSVEGPGFFYPNGTATGAVKMIIEGETNITIGVYMAHKERADHMMTSHSYMSAPEVFIIPHGHPLSPFERLTKPFGVAIWSCLSSSILCGVLIIFGLKLVARRNVRIFVFGYDNRTPLTSLLGTLLGGAVQNKLPRRNFSRYLLALWLLYTMVIRTAYMGELYIMLQDGRGRTSIRTIAEAAANNYTLYTTPGIATILNKTFGAARIKIIDNIETEYPKLLELMATTHDKVALTMSKRSANFYNQQQHDPSKRVNILPEYVVVKPVTMYMPKHSYFLHRINELLQDMLAAGLVKHFEMQYLNRTVYLNNFEHQPTVISLRLLFGLFSVYFVLLFFCVVIFLLELLSTKFPKLRKVLDFCNY